MPLRVAEQTVDDLSDPSRIDVVTVARGPSRKRSRKPIANREFRRRRLLFNHWTMESLLCAAVMCAEDLKVEGVTSRDRSETYGRHGHGANLILARIPALVVTAQYCPPVARRELPSLIAVTICKANLSAEIRESSSCFLFVCSCRSVDGVDGEMSSAAKCEHVETVRELLVLQSCLSNTGKYVTGLMEQASISTSRVDLLSAQEECVELSFAVSSSKLGAAIACVYWSCSARTVGAIPILIRLSKRIREEYVKPELTCLRCPGDNLRPSCKHEIMCAKLTCVREAVATEVRRISGTPPGGLEDGDDSTGAVGMYGTDEGADDANDKDDLLGAHGHEDDWERKVLEAAKDAGTPFPGREYRSHVRRMLLPCLSDLRAIDTRARDLRECHLSDEHEIVQLVDEYGQCSYMACRRL